LDESLCFHFIVKLQPPGENLLLPVTISLEHLLMI